MKTFVVSFYGRLKGAIGIVYRIEETVKADNETEARLKFYDKYEHISRLMIKEV